MTRDDIIRMAKEVGWSFMEAGLESRRLERFAALVAAAKDAEHQQTLALQQRSYEREIQLEVEAEREECAKVAFELGGNRCDVVADAIRARGNT